MDKNELKIKIIEKQKNSRMCLVCGLKNPSGLKARFYELENKEVVAIFNPDEIHQSYPGMLHGGISAAILDETIGRAILPYEKETLGFTIDLHIKYKKPVPLNTELKVIARITHIGSKFFEGTGEIVLPDGTIAVVAKGKYIKVDVSKIDNWDPDKEEWKVTKFDDDPDEIVIKKI